MYNYDNIKIIKSRHLDQKRVYSLLFGIIGLGVTNGVKCKRSLMIVIYSWGETVSNKQYPNYYSEHVPYRREIDKKRSLSAMTYCLIWTFIIDRIKAQWGEYELSAFLFMLFIQLISCPINITLFIIYTTLWPLQHNIWEHKPPQHRIYRITGY